MNDRDANDAAVPDIEVRDVEVLVIGAGQAGLAAAYFLTQRGSVPDDEFVVLDANHAAGGAWQHRWRSLSVDAVHGVHALPGMGFEAPEGDSPAREIVAAYFDRYERRFELPVRRPVAVEEVHNDPTDDPTDDTSHAGRRLLVRTDAGTWRTRALL